MFRFFELTQYDSRKPIHINFALVTRFKRSEGGFTIIYFGEGQWTEVVETIEEIQEKLSDRNFFKQLEEVYKK